MRLETLKCPECGGTIDFKEGQKIQYCPYCGTKLYVDDGNRTIRKEYQDLTHLEEMKFKRKVELEDRERDDKERRHNLIVIAVCIILLTAYLIIMSFVT